MSTRLRALRGATTCSSNSAEEIISATGELLEAVLERNGVEHEDLVSMILTATEDLNAEFPAAAARAIGISDIPLLCSQEMAVPGAVPRCIRVLIHVYSDRALSDLRHVYLREARQLRTDLPE